MTLFGETKDSFFLFWEKQSWKLWDSTTTTTTTTTTSNTDQYLPNIKVTKYTADKPWVTQQFKDCLLYTSPSPRD